MSREIERLLSAIFNITSPQMPHLAYPPYDIMAQAVNAEPAKFTIKVAVAGFRKDDLSVSQEGQILAVRARPVPTTGEEETRYLHRGIAKRAFTLSFPLAVGVTLASANLKDGLLSIHLESSPPNRVPIQCDENTGSEPIQST